MAKQYSFGSGSLWGINTVSSPTPVRFGALQDVQIDIAFTEKELYGSYQFPLAIGRGTAKITGKATYGEITARAYNDLFFGESAEPGSGVTAIADNEAGSVPASSVYTITVSNHTTWVTDLGVIYAATGVPFVRVASMPTIGQYSVAAGVYTFAAADASAAVKISYTYTTTGGYTLTMSNQLLGSSPFFIAVFNEVYNGNPFALQLNRCMSSKLSLPFKLEDFTLQQFEFSAFADDSNTIGIISTQE